MKPPVDSVPTFEEVMIKFVAAQQMDGSARWEFAQSLARFAAANPNIPLVSIGAECAIAVGRAKPYSKAWVSRAINSANLFPAPPATPAEATRFLDAFHGVSSAARRTKGSHMSRAESGTAEDALNVAITHARLAIELGMPSDAVEAAIHASLNQPAEALIAVAQF